MPKGPASLDEKLDTLFGRKPAAAPSSIPSVASSAPSAPAAEVAKPADVKEDLDKKMNTLFKSPKK